MAREKEGDAPYQTSHFSPVPCLSVSEPGDLPQGTKEDLGEASLVLEVGKSPPATFPLASSLHPVVWTNCFLSFSKNLNPAPLLQEVLAQWPLAI